jgi:Rrf2 family nitric oxide-sensitive transcriptional repressor
MPLSPFTDYSFRTLIRAVTCKHVLQVAHRLAGLGYLDAVRGRGEGLVLSRPTSQMDIGELVRKTENSALAECLNPNGGNCCISLACNLKRIFAEARDSFLECLDRYSLDEITRTRATIELLLGSTRNRLS